MNTTSKTIVPNFYPQMAILPLLSNTCSRLLTGMCGCSGSLLSRRKASCLHCCGAVKLQDPNLVTSVLTEQEQGKDSWHRRPNLSARMRNK